jgi:alpha-beta hydrolase superfamily lysophospholipase
MTSVATQAIQPNGPRAAHTIKVPILILHGVADRPGDGGSPMTDVQMARNFETTLKRAGKSVDAHYYENGTHNGIFESETQCDDAVQRIAAFLQRQLRD